MTTRLFYFAGWGIVIFASLYFIYDNALHYFSYNIESYGKDFFPNFAPSLLVHIIFGMTALLIGPFQFFPAIRKNYPRVHHTMGKIYLISVLVAALASLNLSVGKVLITEKYFTFGAGLFMLAIAWLTTSAMAYWAVRSRNFVQHREWMVRSFVVTCGFTSFRLLDKILVEKFHTDPGQTGDLMAWACWAVPLMVTEVIIQSRKINRGNVALAHKHQNN